MNIKKRIGKLFKYLNSGSKRLYAFIVLFCILFSSSYGFFVVTTEEYDVAEMYLSSFLYTLDITAVGAPGAVNNKVVTVPDQTTYTLLVNVGSLNNFRTKYKLEYQTACGNNCKVLLSDVSGWKPYGYINAQDDEIDTKTIKIIVINTSGYSQTVSFEVMGGYVHNSFNSIELLTGYTDQYEKYYDVSPSNNIKTIAKDDMECTASTNSPCYYGGEEERNYITDNNRMYRILGVYLIEGTEYVKLIYENVEGTTTFGTLDTAKTNFYNSLPNNKSDYIAGSVEVISKADYTKIGGKDSYLNYGNGKTMITSDTIGNNVYYINSNGDIVQDLQTLDIQFRPIVTLKSDINIKSGTGTKTDPYIINNAISDINITSITVNNVLTNSFPTTGVYLVTNNCTGGTAQWVQSLYMMEFKTITSPVTCSFSFVSQDILFKTRINGVISDIPLSGNYSMTYKCYNGSASLEWDNSAHEVLVNSPVIPLYCNLNFTSI